MARNTGNPLSFRLDATLDAALRADASEAGLSPASYAKELVVDALQDATRREHALRLEQVHVELSELTRVVHASLQLTLELARSAGPEVAQQARDFIAKRLGA